jgi:hypothetical protein
MNRVKLLSAAALLLTTFAGPVMAEGGHGHGGGGMAMSGGASQSVGARAAPSGGAAVAPSAGTFGGGMRGSSANTATGSMVRGDSGRNFASGGGERGERHEHRGHDGRFAFGAGFGYPYGYDNSYAYYDGDCYLVRRRVMTPYGWRLRRVQVCD